MIEHVDSIMNKAKKATKVINFVTETSWVLHPNY